MSCPICSSACPGALVRVPGLVLGELDELVGLQRLLVGGLGEPSDLFLLGPQPLGDLRGLRLRGLQALGERSDLLLRVPRALVGLACLVLGDLDELAGLHDACSSAA